MLNTDDYLLIAGNPKYWDKETRNRVETLQHDLATVQEEQYDRDRRSLELKMGERGWVVASGTPALTASSIYWSPPDDVWSKPDKGLAACLEWGIRFVNEDVMNREFYVRK